MAVSIVSAPGTRLGPCGDDECGHDDCVAMRTVADSVCPYCEEPIGYGRRFYKLDDRLIVHAFCYEGVLERKRNEVPCLSQKP